MNSWTGRGGRIGRVVGWLVVTLGLATTLLMMTQQPGEAQSSNAIVPGELRVTPTLDHIGVLWFVQGDSDLDSAMTIEYRRAGDAQWHPGAPAMRAEPTITVDGSALGINSWAASAMFLARGTAYEIRATISDPDGGGSTQTALATTRVLPTPGPNQRFVSTGSGGGSGTQADPYRGLQSAANSASPGDTFVVASGIYQPFTLRTSGTAGAPISFVGASNGGAAIVDGGGTNRGVVTLENTDHVIVSGLTIRNGGWGIDAQNTSELLISNNTITDVDFGVYNRRDGNQERYQVVCDNVIEGRTAWPASGIPGERGIDLRGWGHTVCNNTVSDFGDCVSVQPLTGPSFGNDIFSNDANRCVDDGIEVDYNQANVRVYRNRVSNSRQGVSVQPIYGGPAYIFRNELFNLENSTFKLNNGPAGLFVAHNTGIKLENGLEDGSVFNNTVLRNNLIIGTRYAFEFNTTQASPGSRDFDYNAWGSLRTGNAFKWDTVRYATIADLPAGVEDNGVQIDLSALAGASLPTAWNIEAPPGSQNLGPSSGSPVINAGTTISNLNEPFVTDGSPDAGAFEASRPLPGYGPGTPIIPPPHGPGTPTEPPTRPPVPELITLAGRSDAWVQVGGTRNWVSALCRSRFVAAGVLVEEVSWPELSMLVDAVPFQRCDALISEFLVRVVTLPGRSDGWVQVGGTRNWVSALCRARLEGLGVVVDDVSWSALSALADAVPFQRCDALISEFEVRVITLSGRSDGWVQVGSTRNWVSSACRSEFVGAGAVVTEVPWSELSMLVDAVPFERCDVLLARADLL